MSLADHLSLFFYSPKKIAHCPAWSIYGLERSEEGLDVHIGQVGQQQLLAGGQLVQVVEQPDGGVPAADRRPVARPTSSSSSSILHVELQAGQVGVGAGQVAALAALLLFLLLLVAIALDLQKI